MRGPGRTFVTMGGLVVFAAVLSFLGGEKIPRNGGFGFEAFSVYKPIAERFPEFLAERRIDSYSIQRIFPFALAHYTLRALGLPLKAYTILGFFEVYNAVLLVGLVALWLAVARGEGISERGQWLGFLALIVNFAILKLNFYYPVSYDQTALVLGMAALFFYLRDSLAGLFAVSVVGLAVWPTTIVFHSVLLLVPRSRPLPVRPGPPARATVGLIRIAVAAVLYVFYWIYFVDWWRPVGLANVVLPLLPLAFLGVWVYLFRGLRALVGTVDAGRLETWRELFRFPPRARIAAFLLFVAAYLVLVRLLASDARPRLAADHFVANVTFGATTRPLQFVVAHVLFFGPVVLLTFLLWRSVCSRLHTLGAGLTLVCAIGVLQSVNCETRQLMNLWPFFILPTVLAVEERRLPPAFFWTVAAFSVLLSKCWLWINYALPTLGDAARTFPNTREFLSFPDQIWFMNFGPWMSNQMLAVQALVVGAMALWLHRRYLRPRAPAAVAA
jgi:hypothetical protein